MTKVRVYDLAKEYGMKGPEFAELLRRMGIERIKTHMAILDQGDLLQIEATLAAQGYRRASSPADEPTDAIPKKKSLGDKKSLPPEGIRRTTPEPPPRRTLPPAVTTRDLPRKREPLTAEASGTEVELAPLPSASTPTPGISVRMAAPEPPSDPDVAMTAEPSELEPVVAIPPGGLTALHPAVSEPEPWQQPTTEKQADDLLEVVDDIEEPAIEAVEAELPQTLKPDIAPAARAHPADATAPTSSRIVKKLLVPQARARVVGKIDLPQETIRDATRRSAPAGDKDADRKLRRAALQSTQSRTAARAAPGRRSTGPAQRPGPRRDTGLRTRAGRPGGRGGVSGLDPNKVIEIQPPISVKGLSEALGIKVTELISTLAFRLGVKGKTINSFLTPEEVELVALEMGRNISIVEHKEAEDELIQSIVQEAAEADEVTRAPVITFMGHVDHGKTSLLDALRQSDVTKGEAGGITQHIGAYKVEHPSGHSLVILDTPGHAAFTSMRARGAKLTDIVVLVVAGDDGVMPQTEEAIAHAKEANVPIVVAINKCDKPQANPMQVRQQLAVKGLQPEEWGGKVQMVNVSATTGKGLDDLVEKIALESELLELKARPTANGMGTVIESKQTPEQGVVVNVLVTNGTLCVKDRVLVGESLSRIRGMTDDHGRPLEKAGPSTPVTITGIVELPQPGDHLYVVTDLKKAREVVEDRQRRARDLSLAERSSITLENLSAALAAAETKEIKVILKADVMGSLEPIRKVLGELSTNEIRVNMIHAALGGITETDVSLGEASRAVIVGFNSVPDQAARIAAERAGVEIKFYDVIYDLLDDMKKSMEGLLAPAEIEKVTGHAEVRAVFKSSKFGNIAGSYVLDGSIQRNHKVRLSRDGKVIWSGSLQGLRRVKDDVREVKAGFECGITFDGYNDVKVGDQVEAYAVELVKRTLS